MPAKWFPTGWQQVGNPPWQPEGEGDVLMVYLMLNFSIIGRSNHGSLVDFHVYCMY